MPSRAFHDIEDLEDVAARDILVEEVAHRVDEHISGLPPSERNSQNVGMESDIEAVSVSPEPDPAEAFRKAFSIAVPAPLADFGAAGDRIPGRLGPFDGGKSGHQYILFLYLEKISPAIFEAFSF